MAIAGFFTNQGSFQSLAEFNQFFVDVITSVINHETAMQPDLPITRNVVNEIIYNYSRKNSLLRARNGGSFGWVDALFKAADRATPKTKRHWNGHDNFVQNGVSNQQYEEMQKMRERGTPIDGIGLQVYFDAAQPVDPMAIAKNVQRFVKAGFEVSVPELAIGSQYLPGTDSEWFSILDLYE